MNPPLIEWSCLNTQDLFSHIQNWSLDLEKDACVFLEGEMGVGKSTFASFLLKNLGFTLIHSASPTFNLIHEYHHPNTLQKALHVDFYRLTDENNLKDKGIIEYLSENREALLITEWFSQWPEEVKKFIKPSKTWKVSLSFSDSFSEENQDIRKIFLTPL